MADRRQPPRRALIAPLVMLAGGAAAGVVVWRLLMLEPAPPGVEQLSQRDQRALERLLGEHARP